MRFSSWITANGAFGETPATEKPGGILVMRSPWLIQTGCFSPVAQVDSNRLLARLHLDIGAAELAVVAALDLAAELGGHGHLAVADAEHGHAGIEDRLRRARRAFLVHRFRAAGEDHRFRLHLVEGGFGLLERHDLGIDALLAHPARDQLRHLAAEIDDQNLVMRRGHRGRRLARLSVLLSWQANYATGGGLATAGNGRPTFFVGHGQTYIR